jgi:hypothetical protein
MYYSTKIQSLNKYEKFHEKLLYKLIINLVYKEKNEMSYLVKFVVLFYKING